MTDTTKAGLLQLVGLALVAASICYASTRPTYSYMMSSPNIIIRVNNRTGLGEVCRSFFSEYNLPRAVQCEQSAGGPP